MTAKSLDAALDEVLTANGVKNSDLCRAANMPLTSQSLISLFRRGKSDPKCGFLLKLLDALETLRPGARLQFCQAFAEQPLKPDLEKLVEDLDAAELGYLLVLIGDKIKQGKGRQKQKPQKPASRSQKEALEDTAKDLVRV